MKNLFVIGYYNHHNIGDEQYKQTFNYIFNTYLIHKYNLQFIDCDLIKNKEFHDEDTIILGGGDILNNYFMDQIHAKFKNKPNKIIAISVGIPYITILKDNKLNIIDYIFIRTKKDIDILKQFYDENRIMYIPDISYFLQYECKYNSKCKENNENNTNILEYFLPQNKKYNDMIQLLDTIKCKNEKIIALTLSRTIYNKKYEIEYNNILQSFTQLVKYLIIIGFHVILLPYNTNEATDAENDIVIHNDLYNNINNSQSQFKDKVINIDFRLDTQQLLTVYNYLYATIPMRFHACLFSIYKNVPMFPIFTTRKVKNLLDDIKWNYNYELYKNDIDIPIKMDLNKLVNNIHDFLNKSLNTILKNKLSIINNELRNSMDKINEISKIVENDLPKYVIENKTKIIIETVLHKLDNFCKGIDFRLTKDNNKQNLIVQIVSYNLTGTIDSIYNYGLKEKMFIIDHNLSPTFDYENEWKWVYFDNIRLKMDTLKINNKNGIFNLDYIDQNDYSNAHRSGWQYVYDNLKSFNNKDSDLYLDLYIDRTFHWHREINKILEIIPYRKNWVGFIHHTFDTSFSEYNNYNLLKSSEFIESLKYCKGLFVLSKYLKKQLVLELKSLNMNIPVFTLVHPTQINVKNFSYKEFLDNKNKKLIHIGGWLRNIYSFYNIHLHSKYTFYRKKSIFSCNPFLCKTIKFEDTIKKVALKGSSMNNYYPGNDYPENLEKFLSDLNKQQNDSCDKNINKNISCNTSQNDCELTNNWYKCLIEHNKQICKETEILEKLSNDEYDKLLSQNIVFVNLIDASAVNTVIECIVRNCPIIINRHPAVVELLGEKYPLYYGDKCGKYNNFYELNNQINNLLQNTNNIKNAHEYLLKLDKSKFDVKEFTNKFISYMKTIF